MTTTHTTLQWTAGDDWQINATLQDENGAPYDLSGGHTIKWALMNPAFQRVLDEADASISVTDAVAGKITIRLASAQTSPLDGRYTDVIRIVHGGITSTLSYGQIQVAADPWAHPKVAVVTVTYKPLRRVA